MLGVFSPIFVADTKIIFRYVFVAPLKHKGNLFKKNPTDKICALVLNLQ